jgi:hypothetical protein
MWESENQDESPLMTIDNFHGIDRLAIRRTPRLAAKALLIAVTLALVGSTALSARMDPEDLREVISNYQKCVAETVQRFGGFVANYIRPHWQVYPTNRQRSRQHIPREQPRAGTGAPADCGALFKSLPDRCQLPQPRGRPCARAHGRVPWKRLRAETAPAPCAKATQASPRMALSQVTAPPGSSS